ncbi:MAG: cold shock domain-containing protein [Gammaproteobacteria bacterium]|nr:cold shock domain-containing protein [Gammaproteobacteria bacterium]MYE53291.1 cold shock domain-containing protein [Gammaproteobacteria bacterium]MYF12421.1 cold shock domain-containing protein [Gammaproteobacteria bacterium]MYF50917.1 cold shock domain-containing protein [Gammaproteobacteria bacterium]MYK27867.1 cold shock domain-containing protein [Gammaproteobacteria bacterium]
MRTYIIVTASALVLAALVTEAHFRLFAGDYFALLLVTFLALAVNGLFNARLANQNAAAPAKPKRRPAKRAPREARTRLIGGGQREEGKVKWFDEAKGFGFIIRADRSEIFVHKRAIRADRGERPQLYDGRPVSFQVGENEKGLCAENVTAL